MAQQVEDKLHPTHVTHISDASTFDEICTKCGARDITGGGWGALKYPCSKWTKPDEESETTPSKR